jgi:hypothetical protein
VQTNNSTENKGLSENLAALDINNLHSTDREAIKKAGAER